MGWHYAQDGRPAGPVSDSQLADLVRAGIVRNDTLIWRQGMVEWRPYAALLHPPAAPPVLGGRINCAECGRPFWNTEAIAFGKVWVCATCKPVFLQKLKEGLGPGRAVPVPAPTAPAPALVMRSGSLLVMSSPAVLPDRCVKCNAPALGGRLKRTLYWHHPAIYLLLLCSPLIFIIVALVARDRAEAEVGLCARHLARRKRDMLASICLVLAGATMLIAGLAADLGWLAVTGLLVLLAAAIYGVASTQVISATRIETGRVYARGAGAAFLDTLPTWPGG